MKPPFEVENTIIIFGGAKVAALDLVKTTLKVDSHINNAAIHLETTTDGILIEDCPHDDLQKFKKLQAKNLELSFVIAAADEYRERIRNATNN